MPALHIRPRDAEYLGIHAHPEERAAPGAAGKGAALQTRVRGAKSRAPARSHFPFEYLRTVCAPFSGGLGRRQPLLLKARIFISSRIANDASRPTPSFPISRQLLLPIFFPSLPHRAASSKTCKMLKFATAAATVAVAASQSLENVAGEFEHVGYSAKDDRE